MSANIYRPSLRWDDPEELEHQRLEWEAEKDLEHLERPDLERPDLEPYDYSGDRLLDGPEADMFGRPIY